VIVLDSLCIRLFLFALLLLSSGCGYRLANDSGMANRLTVAPVSIEMFTNRSYRPNIETVLTRELQDEFGRRGVRLAGMNGGDLLLTGVVTSFVTTPISFTAADRIREYRATIVAEATLREAKSAKVLWKGSRQASQEYPTNPDNALQQNAEAAAIEAACRKLSSSIYQGIIEDF
jgi:outer membrane lipopolysaccharide assembly protein LptE/RlpB